MKRQELDYLDSYGDISTDPIMRILEFLGEKKLTKKTKEFLSNEMERLGNMKWKSIGFTIYMVPKATPRPRHNFIRNTFYVVGAKDNKEIFKNAIKSTDIPVIDTPCKFTCISYLPIPSSMTVGEKILAEAGLIRPTSKPDWDNLGKTYSDMIQESLLSDDALIIEGISKKYYSLKPRIEIQIEYMMESDSYNLKKNKKKVYSDD